MRERRRIPVVELKKTERDICWAQPVAINVIVMEKNRKLIWVWLSMRFPNHSHWHNSSAGGAHTLDWNKVSCFYCCGRELIILIKIIFRDCTIPHHSTLWKIIYIIKMNLSELFYFWSISEYFDRMLINRLILWKRLRSNSIHMNVANECLSPHIYCQFLRPKFWL